MTATEELRRMLDERGVEWWQSVNMLGCVFTRWYSPLFSDEVVAMENGDGELELFSRLMTPEQAIEATLGRGTCREAKIDRYWRGCGECGYIWEYMYGIGKCESPRFCPNCGRRVVAGDGE